MLKKHNIPALVYYAQIHNREIGLKLLPTILYCRWVAEWFLQDHSRYLNRILDIILSLTKKTSTRFPGSDNGF